MLTILAISIICQCKFILNGVRTSGDWFNMLTYIFLATACVCMIFNIYRLITMSVITKYKKLKIN